MGFKSVAQQGWILVQMLLVAMVVALMILAMRESNLMQVKMNRYFKSAIETKKAALAQLAVLEAQIPQDCDKISWPLIQFVPDTLHDNEIEGIAYYAINATAQVNDTQKQFQSIFAVRCTRKDKTPITDEPDRTRLGRRVLREIYSTSNSNSIGFSTNSTVLNASGCVISLVCKAWNILKNSEVTLWLGAK
jgi:hypothetical protein